MTSLLPVARSEGCGPRGGIASAAGRRLRPTDWLAALGARPRLLLAVAVAAFVMAAAGALLAQQAGRPITSAIIFLLGVTVVGAVEGVWGGLLAAVTASLLYNFFIAEPTFRFSFASVEDYFPLIAFNVCAAASGLLTGRLKDRARAAEQATCRVEALLSLSRKLQGAVDLAGVVAALDAYQSERGEPRVELHVDAGQGLVPARAGAPRSALAERLAGLGQERVAEDGETALLLSGSEGPVGILLLRTVDAPAASDDLPAVANLVSLAVERSLLLSRLADAELVRRSEEFKTALLSSVSHDMRTPLGVISASASSLAQYGADLPADVRADMLTVIQEQCGRLDRYTTNLLNLGRLQVGLDRQRFVPCDALEALGAAIVHVRSAGGERTIEKRLEAPASLVLADPVMLEQIFYNVLENAVRYSPAGSPIGITAIAKSGRLLVSVRDHGPGIPPGEFGRIFDRFYRGRHDQAPDGTGLGLSIAKGFTDAFGGRIWAGLPGDAAGGTIVTIELPLQGMEGRQG